MSIRGVVFDLDDTLVWERDYVRSGFAYIATLCASAIGESPAMLARFLIEDFDRGVRGNTFNRLFDAHPRLRDRFDVPQLVTHYRAHLPRISMPVEAARLIRQLRKEGRWIGLITDGPLESQSRKVQAMRLARVMSPIIATDVWGREFWKPHTRSFEAIEQAWCLPRESLVYIGDNPNKDFLAPNQRGWNTIRLRMAQQMHVNEEPREKSYAPRWEATSYQEMSSLLGITDSNTDF